MGKLSGVIDRRRATGRQTTLQNTERSVMCDGMRFTLVTAVVNVIEKRHFVHVQTHYIVQAPCCYAESIPGARCYR